MPNPLLTRWRKVPERTRGYLVALFLVAAATFASYALRTYLDRSIFILFIAPVAMTAWYAGRGPAAAATILSAVGADWVFLDHNAIFIPTDPHQLVGLGAFFLSGFIIVQLSGLLRASRDAALQNAAILEEQAMELELQTAELEQQTAELEQQTQEAQTLSEELEEAHEALKLSSQLQLSEAQSLAKLGSWEWDIRTNEIKWSDEMFRLYGMEPGAAAVDYDRYQELLHPEDRPIALETINESLKTGKPFSYDHRVMRLDGAERIFHARGKVLHDASGAVVGMLGTGQDVTEARRASEALQKAGEAAARQAAAEAAAGHLNRVLAQAPVAVMVMAGPDHRFELVNAQACSILGPLETLLGRTVSEALPELEAQGFVQLMNSVYQNNEAYVGTEVPARVRATGDERYYNFVYQPLTNDEGVYGILVVANDVSDLVEARLTSERARREAVAASKAKSDFLARMSHELRTPLAAIIGYGELLEDGITGPVTVEQKRQLGRIRSSANHLLAIIDEILTLARMEAGKEKAVMHEIDVGDLMESVATMAEPLAAAKGLGFTLQPVPAGTLMKTDPVKLRQVLLNLLSNGVKYTDKGDLAVNAELSDGRISFFVRDTGIGVDESHLAQIFEPFWQVEQTTTRRAGGTGLGLAVTRQFVELLGGTLSVESEVGAGSTFTVSLPLR